MSVKIRLQRHGRKQAPFYHIVVADARAPRDGRFIEKLGTYNPMTKPATIEIDREKAYQWIMNGAQPTDTVRAILRFKGVLYLKHLMAGVQKGVLTKEQAMDKWQQWVDVKENRIAERRAKTAAEREAFLQMVFGTPKAKPVVEAPAPEETTEEAPAESAEEAPAVEDNAAPEAPAAEEETPAAE